MQFSFVTLRRANRPSQDDFFDALEPLAGFPPPAPAPALGRDRFISITLHARARRLRARLLRVIARRLIQRATVVLRRWHERAHLRADLRHLSDRALHDIGLSRDEALRIALGRGRGAQGAAR